MYIYRDKIGKLKNLSEAELKTIIKNLPCDWDYDYECITELEYLKKYNLRLYRKPKCQCKS